MLEQSINNNNLPKFFAFYFLLLTFQISSSFKLDVMKSLQIVLTTALFTFVAIGVMFSLVSLPHYAPVSSMPEVVTSIFHLRNHNSSSTSSDEILDEVQRSTLVLWSSDFHISPIADIKNIVQKWNVKIIDKSLSGHCHLTKTCATDLKVINQENGIHLSPCPNQLRKQFYNTYRTDPEFLSVDAFICTHANSMCELFMPFHRPMIIIEIGRAHV
jgi:hypothetical protein